MNRLLAACMLFAFATISSGAPPQTEQPREVVKSTSKIEFHAKETFTKVTGVFRSWDVTLKMPADDFGNASLDMALDSQSVTTGNGLKDKEIKGKNFLDVKEYSQIRFVSTSITPDGGGDPTKFLMNANLTMRGITQLVSVAVVVHPPANGRRLIEGDFSFNRRDFGMTHNVPFGKVANVVDIYFHLDVANPPAPQAAQAE